MAPPDASDPITFIHELGVADIPGDVLARTRMLLLDLLGVAVAGRCTELSAIAHDAAVTLFGAGDHPAHLLFDGRAASPAGAALGGGMTIDSVDAHDGHRLANGHAGAAVLPATLALFDQSRAAGAALDGDELLVSLTLGYEVATRAGIALHARAADDHTSGAWNALGCAAVAARVLGLDAGRTRHALGIAEFHGPRSAMMRCLDHPTMLKDGSGWGAMTGVSAASLAARGFTGAPAATLDDVGPAEYWADLGDHWLVREQYVKPFPVCRWAQPAVEAALQLQRTHGFTAAQIARVRVDTFREACRLGTGEPATTEQAQCALAFPVAAALVRGGLGVEEIGADGLADPRIRHLARAVTVVEDTAFSAAYPAERLARVTIGLTSGRSLTGGADGARGDPEHPLTDDELRAKFVDLAGASLPRSATAAIESAVDRLDADPASLDTLLAAVLQPAAPDRPK